MYMVRTVFLISHMLYMKHVYGKNCVLNITYAIYETCIW